MSKSDVRPGGAYLPPALFNVERVTSGNRVEPVAAGLLVDAARALMHSMRGQGYCMRMVRADRSKPLPAALPGRSHRMRPRTWRPLNERQRAEIMADAEEC